MPPTQAHWTSLIDWIEHGVVPAGETPWAEVATAGNAADSTDDSAEPVAEAAAEQADAGAPQTETEPPLRLFNVSAFIKRDT